MPPNTPNEDSPTLRQRLHSATGDRHAEAEALADRVGSNAGDAAEAAVRQAHGDVVGEASKSDSAKKHDLATTADLHAVQESDSSNDRRC
jgi:hypothetical protein